MELIASQTSVLQQVEGMDDLEAALFGAESPHEAEQHEDVADAEGENAEGGVERAKLRLQYDERIPLSIYNY